MRVRFKLVNHGCRNSPYWWIVVQPAKKKLNGRYLEKMGVWAYRKGKTVPRQISLVKHRVRYWLSVGA
jgi:ribosomal protein S16